MSPEFEADSSDFLGCSEVSPPFVAARRQSGAGVCEIDNKASLCGPAAVIFGFAADHPLAYAKFAIELFDFMISFSGVVFKRHDERA